MSKNTQVVSSNPDLICPLCSTCLGWNLAKCTHCGALVEEKTETRIRGIFIGYFASPKKLWDPAEILDNTALVPKEPGIYGFYFDKIPKPVPQEAKYKKAQGMYLLYIGISGNLKERIITNHLKGNYKGSTLAHSLHAVLNIDKNNMEERTEWMIKHMKVAWITDPNPKPVETEILLKYGPILPLNLDENEDRNPFAEDLTVLRNNI